MNVIKMHISALTLHGGISRRASDQIICPGCLL